MHKNKLERYAAERGMTPKQALESLFAGGQKLESVAAELSLPPASIWVYIRQYGANWHPALAFWYDGKFQILTDHCRDLGLPYFRVTMMSYYTGLKQAKLLNAFIAAQPATVTAHAAQQLDGIVAAMRMRPAARAAGISHYTLRKMIEAPGAVVKRYIANKVKTSLQIDVEDAGNVEK